MEDKRGDVMEIGDERAMLMEQLKELQQSFNKDGKNSDKGAKTIQILKKDLKFIKRSKKISRKFNLLTLR